MHGFIHKVLISIPAVKPGKEQSRHYMEKACEDGVRSVEQEVAPQRHH